MITPLSLAVLVIALAIVALAYRARAKGAGAASKGPAGADPRRSSAKLLDGVPPPRRVAIAMPAYKGRAGVFVDPGLSSAAMASEPPASAALEANRKAGEGDRRLIETPSSDPAQRRTEAVDPKRLQQLLAQRRQAKTPADAPKRKTPPPPPVPSAELPAPSPSAFFTQTTRQSDIPAELLERSLPPLGPVTDETEAPALRFRAAPTSAVESGPTREVQVPEIKRPVRVPAASDKKTPAPSVRPKAATQKKSA